MNSYIDISFAFKGHLEVGFGTNVACPRPEDRRGLLAGFWSPSAKVLRRKTQSQSAW